MAKNAASKRRRRLFPQSLAEILRASTSPLMEKQGKMYGALLRDWERIAGTQRAGYCKPQKLQFPTREATSGATLHLLVRQAYAPELAYEIEQLLEHCARYFGYRAIARIVLHPASSELFLTTSAAPPSAAATEDTPPDFTLPPLAEDAPPELREILTRLAHRSR